MFSKKMIISLLILFLGGFSLVMASGEEEAASPEEKEEVEQIEGREEEILEVITQHPEGIKLVDIGEEIGVPWRSLINETKTLVDSGRVNKVDTLYYPKASESSEE